MAALFLARGRVVVRRSTEVLTVSPSQINGIPVPKTRLGVRVRGINDITVGGAGLGSRCDPRRQPKRSSRAELTGANAPSKCVGP